MDCEICRYFEKHPFARETMDDYCNGHDKWMKDLDNDDIWLCPYFEED